MSIAASVDGPVRTASDADYVEYGGRLLGVAREMLKQDPGLARPAALRAYLTTAIEEVMTPPSSLTQAQKHRLRDLVLSEVRRQLNDLRL